MAKNSSFFATLFGQQPLIPPPVRSAWEESAFRQRIAVDERKLRGNEYLRAVPPPRNVALRRG